MEKLVFSQEYVNDNVTMELYDALYKEFSDLNGHLYYGFPTIKILDYPVEHPDIFLISELYGVILVFSDEMVNKRGEYYNKFVDKVERIDSYIYSQMIKHSQLRRDNRNLKFSLTSIQYLPNIELNAGEDKIEGVLTRVNEVIEKIKSTESIVDDSLMGDILATLDASTATIKPKERQINEEDSETKAYVLNNIESQIAKFDQKQRFAAVSMLFGPQRIRGLAGSGKTIILCLKAAYLHLNYPDMKIVYTFFTKSLYDYISQLITRFYMSISDGLVPDFKSGNIQILHGWGGATVNGLYYEACLHNDVEPIKFRDAKKEAKGDEPFTYVCKSFIEETKGNPHKMYDFILIDEAQDFDASFYQLCRSIVKDDHLIWGYDELQNIFNVSIQDTESTFKNEFNKEGIDLEKCNIPHRLISNDIVLPKSYRNIKEILVTAIAYGFGIYNSVLVQSLENNNHWEDLGFTVIQGDCEKEEVVVIERKTENSPLKISNKYQEEDFIEFIDANNMEDEAHKVGKEIIKSIVEDKLRPDDIMVICVDDRHVKRYFSHLSEYLNDNDVFTNNLSDSYYTSGFALPDHVTLTTVYKAKGNEAAMVFVMGCDTFNFNIDSRNFRNKIFTAFTRAKVWLRISGISIDNTSLTGEYKMLKENNYKFVFKNKPHHLLNRDWSESSQQLDIDTMEKVDKYITEMGISVEQYLEYKQKK